MHPKHLSIADYTYSLPKERIAKHPLPNRHDAKLLVYRNGIITENTYQNIADELSNNSTLIFNNTRVIQARLYFLTSTEKDIEIFCLEPDDRYADTTNAMLQQGQVYWKCLIGGAAKWKNGKAIIKNNSSNIRLQAEKIAQENDSYIICFSWLPAIETFATILEIFGNIPLPPYLNRKVEITDTERYQTIYALKNGSVAAPTAGLHFTKHIFETLLQKNIQTLQVTLHVGAGTFKPVKTACMQDHIMHAEYIDISKETIELLIDNVTNKKVIIAVGTTSLRTLESLYWIGWIIENDPDIDMENFILNQWFPYKNIIPKKFTITKALLNILSYLVENNMNKLVTRTQILIAPGYIFKLVKGLITNFHQPKSTLLLLIAAFVGDNWKKIYTYALENNFRFLSYGDGCLLMCE